MIQSINPYSGEICASYEPHTDEQVQEIITNAESAFKSWSALSISERIPYFQRLKELMSEQKEELARVSTSEMGMLYIDAIADINKSISNIDYFCQNAEKLLASQKINNAQIQYEPLGTLLMITPWNYPFNQALRSSIPQNIAGNTIILKHASNIPTVSIKLQELIDAAGFPKGVFTSILYGGRQTGELIKHPEIKGVSITSGESAGKSVGAISGEYLKPCVLELGGNDALVILDIDDIDQAVKIAVKARCSNMGQKCNSSKRFIVIESMYDTFLDKLTVAFENLQLGDPMDPSSQIGPLAQSGCVQEIHKQVQTAVNHGAHLITGGYPQSIGIKDNNTDMDNFYTPTILTNVHPENPLFDEEIFGPVVMVHKAQDYKDAVKKVNASRFGLGCSILGNNPKHTTYVANHVQTGNVAINSIVTSHAHLPYGGIYDSGIGKELWESGIKAFMNEKVIVS